MQLRREVGSLSLYYRYHVGECSNQLHEAISPAPFRRRTTRRGLIMHPERDDRIVILWFERQSNGMHFRPPSSRNLVLHANCMNCTHHSKSFPDGFLLGVATSAIQTEGAWNISNGPSIWDGFVRNDAFKAATKHGETLDISCDSYHKYERDIEMLKQLHAKSYRFSISMPRILPNGQPNAVNKEAISHYNKILDLLKENSITPIVTMYHYDLPQALQDLGGFANPLIETWLTNYAKILYENFGDRVKYWLTMHEPLIMCSFGYTGYGTVFPPAVNASGIAEYICLKNTLKAHASMYRLYEREFKETQKGKVSFAAAVLWAEAGSCSPEDIEAMNHYKELTINLSNDPIFGKEGGWPQYAKEYFAAKSEREGFPYSRLPELSPNEIISIKGTYDFFGLNYYETYRIFSNATQKMRLNQPMIVDDLNVKICDAKTTIAPAIGNPEGIRKVLNYFKDRYGVTDVLVTENGYSTGANTSLDDDLRVIALRATLEELLKAIHEDHINVIGYQYWSLMDNFDFNGGYKKAIFGLYRTDFDSEEKTRTARKSAKVFQQIATESAINWDYNPTSEFCMTL